MISSFWNNTVWYIALAVLCVAIVAFTLAKSKDRKKTLAFFFAVLGLTYLIEVFLLIVTDAYAYYPKIASDSFHESLIGNFFSQYSVSASAVLIAVLGLNAFWQLGFSVAYFLVDVLFVRLQIYSHNWYQSWYTLIGFFVYSWIIKKWYGKMFSHPSKPMYIATLALASFSLGGNVIGTTLNFLEIRRFALGLYEQATKDHTATGVIYGLLITFVLIPLCRMKGRPFLKCLLLLAMIVFDYILFRFGVIQAKAGWFWAGTLIATLGRYCITCMLDRALSAPENQQGTQ